VYLHDFDEFDNVRMSLAQSEEFNLPRAVHATWDNLDGALHSRLSVDAATADGVGTVAQDLLAQVQVVVKEEARFLKRKLEDINKGNIIGQE
jgi:hypothetical protein